MIFALIVFILTYVLMIALPKYRLITVIVSALIFLVFGVLPIKEVFNAIKQNFVTNDSLSTSINELENKINNVRRS